MKAGQMAQAISSVTGADVMTVKVTMRHQREAGFLTQGARGVNAPDMTALDVSRTLLAILADPAPGRRAGLIVDEIGNLPVYGDDNPDEFSLEFMRGLEPPFTFAEALAALIEVYAFDQDKPQYQYNTRRRHDESTVPPVCMIEVGRQDGEPGARIFMGTREEGGYRSQYFFQRPLREQIDPETTGPRIGSVRWINEANIRPLADAFAGRAAT